MTFMFDKEKKKSKIDALVSQLTVSQEDDSDILSPDNNDLDMSVDPLADEPPVDETAVVDEVVVEETPEDKKEEVLKEVDPLEVEEVTGSDVPVESPTSEEPEAVAVQAISSEPKPLIFLGGTCSGSDWRDQFMEKLKDAPFNPYIKDIEWTPQAAQNEVAMRNAAAKIVFGITPKQKGPLTIFELGVSIMASPDRTVVMILNEDDGETWADHIQKAIDVIRASCDAQKVPVFDNAEQCIAFLNGEGETFDEELTPEETSSSAQTDEPTSDQEQAEEVGAVEEENTPEAIADDVNPLEDPAEVTDEPKEEAGFEPEDNDLDELDIDDDSASPDDI